MGYGALSFGYWFKSGEVGRLSFVVSVGRGKFEFQNSGTASYEETAQAADFGIKAAYVFDAGGVRIPLTGGVGLVSHMPSDCTYNGVEFSRSDFQNQVYLMVGLGVNF